MKKALLAGALGCIMATGASAATIVLSDDFSYGTTSVVPVTPTAQPGNPFASNWTTTPSVDYLAVGSAFGNLCATGMGQGCIDLNGSTRSPGILSTVQTFAAGSYALTVDYAGNQRSNVSQGFRIAVGGVEVGNVSPIGWQDSDTFTTTFTTLGGSLSFFTNEGEVTNIGPILNRVEMSAVPLPAGGLLLLTGLAGLAAARRKSRA